MKKVISLTVIAVLLLAGFMKAQNGNFAKSSLDSIKRSVNLVYFGADFSRVKVTDESKVLKNDAYRTAYPPAWISFIEKRDISLRVRAETEVCG